MKTLDWLRMTITHRGLLPLKTEFGHDDEFNRDIDLTRDEITSRDYDAVDLTNMLTPVSDLELSDEQVMDIFYNPALVDFVLTLNDSNGIEIRFLLHAYGKRGPKAMAKDLRSYLPILDVYHITDDEQIVEVTQVLILKSKPDRYFVRPVAQGRRFVNSVNDVNVSDMFNMTDYLLWHYLYVMDCFKNRPERFVQIRQYDKQHWVLNYEDTEDPKIIKIEHIERASVNVGAAALTGRRFSCPCWTVSGHYRTLKSGKKVWVRPYTKGSERHDPTHLQTKTYKPNKE